MIIRYALLTDCEALLLMVNQMYEELDYGVSFGTKWVEGRLRSKFFMTSIVEEDETPVGFCTVKMTKNEYGSGDNEQMGFLYELYLSPPYRKKGYARTLLAHMEQELLELGIHYMELYVSVKNTNGYDFWVANNYKEKYKVLYKQLTKGS